MAADSRAAQPGIVTLSIADKNALYMAYMPFIGNGGMFIPTTRRGDNKAYRLGEEVFLLLHLVEQNERLPMAGKVVWVTPPGAQGQRLQGIGIQFSAQDAGATQQRIETLLADVINSDRPTHAM